MKHFNNIKKIRKAIPGFTQEKLANLIGVTTRHVQHLEAGGSDLSIDITKRISQALNCTPADILGYENLGIAPPNKKTNLKEESIKKDIKIINVKYHKDILNDNYIEIPFIENTLKELGLPLNEEIHLKKDGIRFVFMDKNKYTLPNVKTSGKLPFKFKENKNKQAAIFSADHEES